MVASDASSGVYLSVVVPCFNEEETLGELHRRASKVCLAVAKDSFEIVLVNDGSRDRSWPLMVELSALHPHLVCVNLSRNHGHQLALTAGLQICRGERILVIDADLQDPPELLHDMMARMNEGCDVVDGQRISRDGETWFKRTSALAFYRLLERLGEVKIPLDTGDFRLMSRRALGILNSMPEHHRFIRGMVSWIGLRQEPLLYERAARFAGETKYPLSKMLKLGFDAITGFSVQPLRIASYLGLFSGLCGIAALVYVIVGWLRGETVQGWTSLMFVVLLIGSSQLLVAGLMGEYLGRLYMEAKRRPLFIVQDVVRSRVAEPSAGEPRQPTDQIRSGVPYGIG